MKNWNIHNCTVVLYIELEKLSDILYVYLEMDKKNIRKEKWMIMFCLGISHFPGNHYVLSLIIATCGTVIKSI